MTSPRDIFFPRLFLQKGILVELLNLWVIYIEQIPLSHIVESSSLVHILPEVEGGANLHANDVGHGGMVSSLCLAVHPFEFLHGNTKSNRKS